MHGCFCCKKNDLTELKCVSINEILRKAVVLSYKKDKLCIFPLLHSDVSGIQFNFLYDNFL